MTRFKCYSVSIFLAAALLVGCPDDDSDDGDGGAMGMGGAVGGAMGMGGEAGGAMGGGAMGGAGMIGGGGLMCGEASGPLIMPDTLPDGALDEPYEQDLEALGGPQEGLIWTVDYGALPPGIALDADTGTLSGTPSEVGEYTFAVMVTVPADDAPCPVQPGYQEYTVNIVAPPG
jgi:hypothetical protein